MKKLLLLFVSATLLMACSDDDTKKTQPIEVHGAWTMTKYMAFAPELPPLADGQVVWVFNNNNTVTMTNQAPPHFSSIGTFNYHIEGDAVFIETEDGFEEKYFYSFPDGGLRLESELASSDGPIMVFKSYQQ